MISEKQMKHIKRLAKLNKERYKKYGHNKTGTKHSKISIQKMKKSAHRGKNHYNWKGNNVGYNALHQWVRRNKSKPKFCEKCNKYPPKEIANISGEYKREFTDWEWLCRKCHKKKDFPDNMFGKHFKKQSKIYSIFNKHNLLRN